MKKSNFISMIDNKAVLTQPLYYNEDIYRLKHETKRTILEIREAVGHCILGFSSGTDSIFIYCCIRELIEEGKLTKDAIDIVFFNVDFSNFTFSEAKLGRDKLVQWRLNYWKDIYRAVDFKPTIEDLLQYYKACKKYNIKNFSWYEFLLAYCRNCFDYPVLVGIGHGNFTNEFRYEVGSWHSIYEDSNQIDVYFYDKDVFCAFLEKDAPSLLIDGTYPLYRESIRYFAENKRYFNIFYETMYGHPKCMEWPILIQGFKPSAQTFFRKLFNPEVTVEDSLEIRSRVWKPIYLPNGDAVTSVEQTQEFFNRHS